MHYRKGVYIEHIINIIILVFYNIIYYKSLINDTNNGFIC